MAGNISTNLCGLSLGPLIPNNDTTSQLNEKLAASVNLLTGFFAFLSNLLIILAIMKTPSLQKPCNILLCSLASADCLTGAVAQPVFVAWRLTIPRVYRSCTYQAGLVVLRELTTMLISGWSLLSLVVISFDRHYALSRPLIYRANATKKGAVKMAVGSATSWIIWTFLLYFIVPSWLSFILFMTCGVLYFVTPVVNHIRMFLAVRKHNKEVQDTIAAQQLSAIISREKKVAKDMLLVTILLFASIVPSFVLTLTETPNSRIHSLLYSWGSIMLFLNSSLNPILFLIRNKDLRIAIRSLFST